MKVAIIEDETVAAKNIVRILSDYDADIEVLQILKSVRKAVEWLKFNLEQVDLLFMDIQLSDGISFQIFEQVKVNKPTIFTTAFNEYAIQAFKVNSVDYLLKPISLEMLTEAMQKFKSLQQPTSMAIDYQELSRQIQLQTVQYKSRFLVKSGNHLKPLDISQIAYFVADGNLVLLISKEQKKYPVNYALSELEQKLDPKFFYRITRNMIIHIQSIEKVAPYFKGRLLVHVQPKFDADLVVSSGKAAEFKAWLDA